MSHQSLWTQLSQEDFQAVHSSWSKCLNQLESDVYRPGIVQDAKGRSCLSVGCDTTEYEGPVVDLVDQYYRVPQVLFSFTVIHLAFARCHGKAKLPQYCLSHHSRFHGPHSQFAVGRIRSNKKDSSQQTCQTTNQSRINLKYSALVPSLLCMPELIHTAFVLKCMACLNLFTDVTLFRDSLSLFFTHDHRLPLKLYSQPCHL